MAGSGWLDRRDAGAAIAGAESDLDQVADEALKQEEGGGSAG
jgi:hypothetical protein